MSDIGDCVIWTTKLGAAMVACVPRIGLSLTAAVFPAGRAGLRRDHPAPGREAPGRVALLGGRLLAKRERVAADLRVEAEGQHVAAGLGQVDEVVEALLGDRDGAVTDVLAGVRGGDRPAVQQYLRLPGLAR